MSYELKSGLAGNMTAQEKFGKICKDRMVEELAFHFKNHPNFIITSYMGSTVADLERLRRSMRKSQSQYLVVKNSILKVVLAKLKLESEASSIDGGIGISLSGSDIIGACKSLVTFSRDHERFKIKCAVINGAHVSVEKIRELAALPPKDVLLARVVGGIGAPISGFVNTLAGVLRKFVYVVDAIKTTRQKGEA